MSATNRSFRNCGVPVGEYELWIPIDEQHNLFACGLLLKNSCDRFLDLLR